MILGIGIDAVEVERFCEWQNFSKEKLQKIFSDHEIEYCLSNKKKSSERFAARFASKEAFFKAFCQMNPDHSIPFLQICRSISVLSTPKKASRLIVDWINLQVDKKTESWISITHTKSQATCIVILEN